jgi:hypothetical protein
MTELRLVGDAIEMNGVTVGVLIPGLRLSLRDELIWAFDAIDEDEATIVELEGRVAQLEAQLKKGSPSSTASKVNS